MSAPRLKLLAALVLSIVAASAYGSVTAVAEPTGATPGVADVQFNEQFLLAQDGTRVDIARFNKGNVALPGTYKSELYVNEVWRGRVDVKLGDVGGGRVEPCFDNELLQRVGVDMRKLSEQALAAPVRSSSTGACMTLPSLVKDATATFDNSEQRLDVSVPQIALDNKSRGYVDPKYWDNGVTAAMLQYNANVYRSNSGGLSSTQSYVGVNAGVNVGAWRFRSQGNVTQRTGTPTRYQSVAVYAQRGITPLKGQLTIGDSFTDGAVYDSFGLRGVQLTSDDRMLPESQRGYAPVIRGVANSNAKVQIRQNGNIIYETNVAPGAFAIDDLYPTGYGGDLQVVVTEADGSVRTSTVPFSSPVNALRAGVTRYSFVAGQYRNPSLHDNPPVFQFTLQRGLNNTVTAYGGAVVAQDYVSGVLGAAINTKYGAFGFDVTQSYATFGGRMPARSGQSYRFSYSKLVAPTDTNVSVAAYRYSTGGFLSMQDAAALRDPNYSMQPDMYTALQKSRLELTLNQSLGEKRGTLYLTGSTQNYWNRGGTDTQFQAGYNNFYKRIGYGVSVSREFDSTNRKWDTRVMANVTIPLGTGGHAPTATTMLQHDSASGGTLLQQSVAGTLGDANAVSYGVNASYAGGGSTGASTTAGGNVSYTTRFATLTANAGAGTGYTQAGAGIAGGIVAYGGGIAFAPQLGDTFGIVEAKGADGARVASASGVRVDPWGHAVVSSLTPYASNDVELDPKGLPVNVTLKSTVQHAVPTLGAVVPLKFETEAAGRALLLRVRLGDGTPPPFGAPVFDADGANVGTVSQDGLAVVTGLTRNEGDLSIRWDAPASKACTIHYTLPQQRTRDVLPALVEVPCM
ncbi:fimbria/pilus outer membrane usher protein [Paraburkholderia rhizosphaerae]|uniref:fimbria/pilus outer membrane usher protein n=1 Tax=Paraburkholderia rhizosphaerae TaxID=480658 RepID=UPI001FB9CFAB|nr:fimbria/pilus outer membrane usher protein [Paraburkholderia rhizosphaerae]